MQNPGEGNEPSTTTIQGNTTTPDASLGGGFGGLSITELVNQMQQFYKDKGMLTANPAHQVP